MNQSNVEDLEFDQLSEKFMLNLRPIKKNKKEDFIKDMIIDYHQEDPYKNQNCNFKEKFNSSDLFNLNNKYSEKNLLINKELYSHLIPIKNQSYNRSSSLPPSNYQGLNLFNKEFDQKFSNNLNNKSNNYISINSKNQHCNSKYIHNTDNNINKFCKSIKDKYIDKNPQLIYIQNTKAIIGLIFNIILISTCIYIILAVIFVIKNDIESKIQVSITNIIEDINICSKQYIDNKCQPEQRVPAMETKCNEWEKCMSQNPTIIAKKSIFTAQIIGQIINTFLDQISFKSALFIFGFILSLIIGNFFVITSSISGVNSKDNKKIICSTNF